MTNTNDEKIENEEIDKELRDQKILKEILSDKILIFILQTLRQGPLEQLSIQKLIKVKYKKKKINPKDYFQKLIDCNYIRDFEYYKEKPNPDRSPDLFPRMKVGEKKKFYLLTKDFYAIRKPPARIIPQISGLKLNSEEINSYKRELEKYFNKYTVTQSSGDDLDVIEVFSNDVLFLAINLLSSEIKRMDLLEDYIKNDLKANPDEVINKLLKKKFIRVIKQSNSNKKYVVLLTDIEVKAIYPEYLLRNFNQKLAEKEIDKEFALKTLSLMRKYYLELEKPELLEESMELVEKAENIFEELLSKDPKKIKVKKARKAYNELHELYNKVGMVDNIKEIEEKWKALKKKIE